MLTSLKVGGEEVGISGLSEIIDKGLTVMESPDHEVRQVLLAELKARNYVPSSAHEEYLKPLWAEFKKARVQRREQLEMSYKGIPREAIPWYPRWMTSAVPGVARASTSAPRACSASTASRT